MNKGRPSRTSQSTRSAADNDDSTTEHGLLEQEYSRLQRQYKIMEGDRKAYSEESQNAIAKQRIAITKLERDNTYLMGELELAKSLDEDAKRFGYKENKMSELKQQAEFYKRKIKAEQEDIQKVDCEIEKLEKAIVEQQKKMGGANATTQKDQAVTKQIRVLENRLDKALVKFNESLATNRKLRETIDNLRRERRVFDTIYKKLEREMQDAKRKMADIIESSNQAYESRDEAQAKLALLKEKVDKEVLAYNTEIKDLVRFLEQDRKFKSFMGVKSQDRDMGDTNTQSDGKAKASAGDDDKGGDSVETVQSYDEAFARIKQATGIDDIDKLVDKFQEEEKKNFSLFHYINELNNEVETLDEQAADIKLEINSLQSKGLEMDTVRNKQLKDLEDRLQVTERQTATYEQRATKAGKGLAQLKVGIAQLFEKIGCDTSAIGGMLGNSGVSDSNMLQYLGIIEQRTNEILQMYNSVTQKDGSAGEPLSLLGKGPLPIQGKTQVVPPSTTEFDSDEDEDDDAVVIMPLTREEIKAKVESGSSDKPRVAQPQKKRPQKVRKR